ncbi:CBS domain-containing protein [Tindallia californiensis]|uniref:CBS domain-containing membrane protein n=1 Tax=Tindallia californiensis TaxID=159292 RepID=A0A1H3J0Q0_9FIRM|nr:CBS domain-containing protein [Tindallia californiensis]SDY33462.1 CBS domain-containing membrane protein [Tindallia californiensis]
MKVKAKDVMNAKVISVTTGTTLKEAVRIFADYKISALPVVDMEEKLVGILSETDIVEYCSTLHVVPMLDSSGWISPYENPGDIYDYKQGFELLEKTKVEKLMSRKVVTVQKDTLGTDIAKIMKKKKINHVPVLEENGKLCGIIARADLINYLASIGE